MSDIPDGAILELTPEVLLPVLDKLEISDLKKQEIRNAIRDGKAVWLWKTTDDDGFEVMNLQVVERGD